MLIACYCVYNNADLFRASLEVIYQFVDQIIIVDGRYGYYAQEGDISTDGTLEVAKEFQQRLGMDKVIITEPQFYESQIGKRNVYLDYAKHGDWLFVIDGDEIPFGHLDLLKNMLATEEAHVVNVLEYDRDITTCQTIRRPRLIRKLDGMKYEANHYSIYHQKKNIFISKEYTDQRVYPIQILHFNRYKPALVKQRKEAYLIHLYENEIETRYDNPEENQFYQDQGIGNSVDLKELMFKVRKAAAFQVKKQKQEEIVNE